METVSETLDFDSELAQRIAPRKFYRVATRDIFLQNMKYAILKVCGTKKEYKLIIQRF
jgi:hypothetical protein